MDPELSEWLAPWYDCGAYWLSPALQGSKRHKIDSLYRITMAKISKALDRVPVSFGTSVDAAYDIAGIRRHNHSMEAVERMNKGIQREPKAREWMASNVLQHLPVCSTSGGSTLNGSTAGCSIQGTVSNSQLNTIILYDSDDSILSATISTPEYLSWKESKTLESNAQDPRMVDSLGVRRWLVENHPELSQIEEVGVAVPKWNPIFGASPDGLIGTEFGIEIKSPDIMYKPLLEKLSSQNQTPQSSPSSQSPRYDHIYNSHYDQIQGGMMCFQRPKWIYVVYCEPTKQKYIEVIPYDHEHCVMLSQKGIEFYNTKVRPLLGMRAPINPLAPDYRFQISLITTMRKPTRRGK